MTPKNKPQLSANNAKRILSAFGEFPESNKIILLGVRGYYGDSFGIKRANDREFYDDALFSFVGDSFSSWNFTVDPFARKNGVANLCCGIYEVVKHSHKGKYNAFQIVRDVLRRDGTSEIDTGRHGINFHYGSRANTDSLGCQTMPKDQFLQFQPTLYRFMDDHKIYSFRYILTSFN